MLNTTMVLSRQFIANYNSWGILFDLLQNYQYYGMYEEKREDNNIYIIILTDYKREDNNTNYKREVLGKHLSAHHRHARWQQTIINDIKIITKGQSSASI